ncbi:MAG TPA: carboxypeptidase regulatory-like domain-containing protein, partial [Polyangiaceae bacterium]
MTFFRRASLVGAALIVELASIQSAQAQQGAAVLTGTITDAATKAPVPDCVVTVSSPTMQGEQVVVTDSAGQYRIPNLPSGAFTMRLEKESFKPFQRSDIVLRSDATIRVDAELLPEALKAEEVVVVGKAPTVDVGSSSTGMNINSDFTRNIPIAAPGGKGAGQRSFEAVAEATPGAKADTYGTSISGATSPENQYVIDGLSVNNPALGIIGTPLSTEFVGEVNVISGGYMPEYGRSTGGILSAVTKSGSNEFHGGVWGYFSPGGLEGPRHAVKRDGSTILTAPKLVYQGDIGFDIGGPLVKDKLWFYAGVDVARTVYQLDRTLNRTVLGADGRPVKDADGFTQTTEIPGTFHRYNATVTSLQTFAKLTYTVNDDNKLVFTGIYAPAFSGGNGDFGMDPTTGAPETTNLAGSYSALAHKYDGGSL